MNPTTTVSKSLSFGCASVQPFHAQRSANQSKHQPDGLRVDSACDFCASKSRCPAVSLIQAIPGVSEHSLFHPHSLQAGEHVFHCGDQLEAFYIVKSGSIKTYMPSRSSSEHVVSFGMPGNVFGIDALANNCHDTSACALIPSTYCAAPINSINTLVRKYHPDWLVKLASTEVVRDQHTMQLMSQKNAKSRITAFLISMSQRFASRGYSGQTFNLSMAREDIGNHLGLAMETISRTLSRLQDKGLIRIERRKVEIVDMDELKKCLD